MELTLHVDGGSRGNPGPAAAGVVVTREDGTPLLQAGYYLGVATNNVAEYEGLLRALRVALDHGASAVQIVSDSQLLVRQLKGEYRVRSADLRPLYEQAQDLLKQVRHWRTRHVAREHNRQADRLVNQALDARRDVVLDSTGATAAKAHEIQAKEPSAHGPQWVVRFSERPSKTCPMSGAHGSVFRFGPDTPAGLCVFAAQAVLNSGVLSGDRAARQMRCPRCGAVMQLVPTGG